MITKYLWEAFFNYLENQNFLIKKKELLQQINDRNFIEILLLELKVSEKELKEHLSQFQNSTNLLETNSEEDDSEDDKTKLPQDLDQTKVSFYKTSSVSKTTKAQRQKETETITPFSISSTTSTKTNSEFKEERYEVIETLGVGGMGVVQLVKDQQLGREVALKKIKVVANNPALLTSKQKMLLWRLQTEASITAILEHPNIVPLYDMQKKETGDLYFTMRKVSGQTLTELIKTEAQESSPDKNHLLSIFLKICDAISYAHSKGVIHRDLKPDNIMVGEFGEVYVMDWGIAKKLAQEKKETNLFEINPLQNQEIKWSPLDSEFLTIGGIGTPGYMPLEQKKQASNVAETADIFALGKILKQCFTGISPQEEFQLLLKSFRNENKKKTQAEPIIPAITTDIQAIVQKATQEDPKTRYQQVQELAADIELYLKNKRISVRQYNLLETSYKWIQRNRNKVSVALIIILLCLTFFAYSSWEKQKTKENKFNKAFYSSLQEKQQASEVQILGAPGTELKIQYLINSLNLLNTALSVKPFDFKAEQAKYQISTLLLKLCYQTQEYQLASYVVNDMKTLSLLTPNQMQRLTNKMVAEKTKRLRYNLERLDYWKEQLRNPLEGTKEKALLEINKMQEPEIFQQLIALLEEGTNYFSQAEKRDVKKGEYYRTMAEILGWLENPDAGEPLLQAMRKIEKQIAHHPIGQKPIAETQFMIAIANSLAFSKAKKMAKPLQETRWRMGEHGIFWSSTKVAYQTLAKRDNIENSLVPPPEFFTQKNLEKFANGQWKIGIQNILKEMREKPKSAEWFASQGYKQIQSGNYKAAIESYNTAIRLNPKLETNYLNRGTAKQFIEDWDGAIADHTKAIEINPKNAYGYNNRGNAKTNKGDYKGATEDFNSALKLNPKDSKIYNNFGQLKQQQEDFKAAMEAYNYAIKLNPKNEEAYNNRGLLKHLQQDYNGAIIDLTKATEINPNFGKAYNNRGNAKKRKGDLVGAIQDLTESIRLMPQDFNPYINRGKIYILLQRQKNKQNQFTKFFQKKEPNGFELAIKDLTKVIELRPNYFNAYNNRGVAYQELKKYKEAIADYTTLLKMNPQYLNAYFNRGLSKKLLGNKTEALKDFVLFLEKTKDTQNKSFLTLRNYLIKKYPELKEKQK